MAVNSVRLYGRFAGIKWGWVWCWLLQCAFTAGLRLCGVVEGGKVRRIAISAPVHALLSFCTLDWILAWIPAIRSLCLHASRGEHMHKYAYSKVYRLEHAFGTVFAQFFWFVSSCALLTRALVLCATCVVRTQGPVHKRGVQYLLRCYLSIFCVSGRVVAAQVGIAYLRPFSTCVKPPSHVLC